MSNDLANTQWRQRLAWYRCVDQAFVDSLDDSYLLNRYGFLVQKIEELVFEQLKQQLSNRGSDSLFAALNLDKDGYKPVIRYHENGRTSYFDVPLVKQDFVKLESGLGYGVKWQITLPGRLSRWIDNDHLRIPLVWNSKIDAKLPIKQVQSWHSRVVVHVLYGYDLSGDYYWDPNNGGKFSSALKAYQHYLQWRKSQFLLERWLLYPVGSLKTWKNRYQDYKVDLSQEPVALDPKAVDMLGQSSGYNREFQQMVDPVTWQIMSDFNYLWHDILHYPVFLFEKPQIILHV